MQEFEFGKRSTAAVKEMCRQDVSIVSSSEEKTFHYHQGHINVAPLYLATKLADVHFVFDSDDGTVARIPAHKNLLAVASDVLERMFCGELKENGDIKIVDSSVAAFKEFLQFFYLSDVKLSAKHVESILYLGNKYNVEKCVEACVKFFTDDMSNENACDALSLAILCDQKELKKACEKQIILNTADVIKSTGFSGCSKEVLAHFLNMNLLVLSCSESDIFEACMEWVRVKSQQQVLSKAIVEEHLGDLYYQIRFTSMTPQEFFNLKTKYNEVLSADFEAIMRLITQVDTQPERFNTSPRQVKWNKDEHVPIECDLDCSHHQNEWQALNIEEKTTFSTNTLLVLGEFACNEIGFREEDPQDLRSNLLVEVNIIERLALDDANGKILCSWTVHLMRSGCTPVLLPHPILIRPNLFYTICIKGFPDGHYVHCYEREKCVTLESNIEIQLHNDEVDEDEIRGLIWLLLFKKI